MLDTYEAWAYDGSAHFKTTIMATSAPDSVAIPFSFFFLVSERDKVPKE